MTQPAQHILDVCKRSAWRHGGPVDHYHRNAQRTGGVQFGPRACTARVLGDDQFNFVLFQQRQVTVQIKRPTGDHHVGLCQGHGLFGRIDQTQQIAMPGLGRKESEGLLANRQKHPRRCLGQSLNRALQIDNTAPVIAVTGTPRRALESGQRDLRSRTGGNRVAADLRGKGMGCVHDAGDTLRLQEMRQTLNATKTTHPRRQGLCHRQSGAARIAEQRIGAAFGQCAGQRRCLGGAAKNKGARHV